MNKLIDNVVIIYYYRDVDETYYETNTRHAYRKVND